MRGVQEAADSCSSLSLIDASISPSLSLLNIFIYLYFSTSLIFPCIKLQIVIFHYLGIVIFHNPKKKCQLFYYILITTINMNEYLSRIFIENFYRHVIKTHWRWVSFHKLKWIYYRNTSFKLKAAAGTQAVQSHRLKCCKFSILSLWSLFLCWLSQFLFLQNIFLCFPDHTADMTFDISQVYTLQI